MLTGNKLISSYYSEFFKKTKTLNFSKESFEIQPIGNFYIELGNESIPHIGLFRKRIKQRLLLIFGVHQVILKLKM